MEAFETIDVLRSLCYEGDIGILDVNSCSLSCQFLVSILDGDMIPGILSAALYRAPA